MRLLATLCLLAIAAAPAAHAQSQPTLRVTITAPANGDGVLPLGDVAGTVSDATAEVWVIVQPLAFPSCWVQPRPYVEPADGKTTWSGRMFIGDARTPPGSEFKVVAIANPKRPLAEGQVTCWPAAQARSPSITVRRR